MLSLYYNAPQTGLHRQGDLNSIVKNALKKDWKEVNQIVNRASLQMTGISLHCIFLFSPIFL